MLTRSASSSSLSVSQAAARAAAHGAWAIKTGEAMTLRPAAAGSLRVMQGRIWVTEDGPHPQQPERCGDQFLSAGASVALRAGQRVVIESYPVAGDRAPAQLSWVPARQSWAEAVRQPTAELVQSLRQAAQALGHAGHALTRLLGVALQPR